MQRVRLDGTEKIRRVIVETGGAVVLCSLTTTLGYLVAHAFDEPRHRDASVWRPRRARSRCILAAVLVFPAALVWLRARKTRPEGVHRRRGVIYSKSALDRDPDSRSMAKVCDRSGPR